jgi:hypothetical protein
MRQWLIWMLPPWGSETRRAERLAAAQDWQQSEQEAACRRIIEMGATGTPTPPAEHEPGRPSWDCGACGEPWPCPPARESLATEMCGHPTVLNLYMSAQLAQAADDLAATYRSMPPNLVERFTGWLNLRLLAGGRVPQATEVESMTQPRPAARASMIISCRRTRP